MVVLSSGGAVCGPRRQAVFCAGGLAFSSYALSAVDMNNMRCGRSVARLSAPAAAQSGRRSFEMAERLVSYMTLARTRAQLAQATDVTSGSCDLRTCANIRLRCAAVKILRALAQRAAADRSPPISVRARLPRSKPSISSRRAPLRDVRGCSKGGWPTPRTRARHLCDFLEVATHTILKERNLYPAEIFSDRRCFGVPVSMARHPEVEAYVKKTLKAVEPLLASGRCRSGGHRRHGRHARRTGGEVRVSGRPDRPRHRRTPSAGPTTPRTPSSPRNI